MNKKDIHEILENIKDESLVFCELLLKYNKTHNISGAKTKNDVMENIYDSLYPLKFLNFAPKNAIDIGSGAGFPGIILSLFLRETSFTLFEPITKKSAFLHVIKSEFQLSHVRIETKRVENAQKNIVDLITSRAVDDVKVLIKLANGYYNETTTFLLYKGSRAEDEIDGIKNVKIYERNLRKYVFIKGLKNDI